MDATEGLEALSRLNELAQAAGSDSLDAAKAKEVGTVLLSTLPLEGMVASKFLGSSLGQSGLRSLKNLGQIAKDKLNQGLDKAEDIVDNLRDRNTNVGPEEMELQDFASMEPSAPATTGTTGTTTSTATTTGEDLATTAGEDIAATAGEDVAADAGADIAGDVAATAAASVGLDALGPIGVAAGVLATLGVALKDLFDPPHHHDAPPPVFSSYQIGA